MLLATLPARYARLIGTDSARSVAPHHAALREDVAQAVDVEAELAGLEPQARALFLRQPRVSGGDLRTVAEKTFERLGMTKTALRNGVLLFIATEEYRFVILGDKGINEKVPAGFWDEIAAKLTIRFKNQEFTDGIVEAITAAGGQLGHYFPRAADDVNELSDTIDVEE